MTTEPQLPPHIAQRLNDLHAAHVISARAEARADLLHDTPGYSGPTQDEARRAAWKARCAFYAYTSKLSGGVTGT